MWVEENLFLWEWLLSVLGESEKCRHTLTRRHVKNSVIHQYETSVTNMNPADCYRCCWLPKRTARFRLYRCSRNILAITLRTWIECHQAHNRYFIQNKVLHRLLCFFHKSPTMYLNNLQTTGMHSVRVGGESNTDNDRNIIATAIKQVSSGKKRERYFPY